MGSIVAYPKEHKHLMSLCDDISIRGWFNTAKSRQIIIIDTMKKSELSEKEIIDYSMIDIDLNKSKSNNTTTIKKMKEDPSPIFNNWDIIIDYQKNIPKNIDMILVYFNNENKEEIIDCKNLDIVSLNSKIKGQLKKNADLQREKFYIIIFFRKQKKDPYIAIIYTIDSPYNSIIDSDNKIIIWANRIQKLNNTKEIHCRDEIGILNQNVPVILSYCNKTKTSEIVICDQDAHRIKYRNIYLHLIQ